MSGLTTIQIVAVSILPVLFAVILHEVAHGYVASLLGDQTARILGRLSLNPVKHIDLIGTIIVPVTLLLLHTGIIFGWAKPVPINPYNFHNPRRDAVLVAFAGPLANFLMALFWAGIVKLGIVLLAQQMSWALAVYSMGQAGITINLVLMVFNLLPLPGLDGGHILSGFLPLRAAYYYDRFAQFSFIILLGLLITGILGVVLQPVMAFLYGLITIIFSL